MALIREIDAPTLKSWIDSGQAVVVDVREADEHARERIAGSRLMPLSGLDPGEVPRSNGQKVVLHCRGGRRSADAAARLVNAGHPEAIHLKGGLEAWKAAGFPVEVNRKVPISLMRQVQIVVGTLVLATVILGVTVSPWFLALTGFFGAGLLFAGLSGTCGMAAVLSLMPWNRAACPGGSPSAGLSRERPA